MKMFLLRTYIQFPRLSISGRELMKECGVTEYYAHIWINKRDDCDPWTLQPAILRSKRDKKGEILFDSQFRIGVLRRSRPDAGAYQSMQAAEQIQKPKLYRISIPGGKNNRNKNNH